MSRGHYEPQHTSKVKTILTYIYIYIYIYICKYKVRKKQQQTKQMWFWKLFLSEGLVYVEMWTENFQRKWSHKRNSLLPEWSFIRVVFR